MDQLLPILGAIEPHSAGTQSPPPPFARSQSRKPAWQATLRGRGPANSLLLRAGRRGPPTTRNFMNDFKVIRISQVCVENVAPKSQLCTEQKRSGISNLCDHPALSCLPSVGMGEYKAQPLPLTSVTHRSPSADTLAIRTDFTSSTPRPRKSTGFPRVVG